MRLLTLALCVTLIAALAIGVCGCTTNTNTSTTTQKLAPDALAGAINDRYRAHYYTVDTPFTMTTQGNTITYTGVVTDGTKVGTPHKHNVTLVLTPDRATAKTTYNGTISQQKAQGYQEFSSSQNSWHGYLGTTSSTDPSTPSVWDQWFDPSENNGLWLPGASGFESLDNADLSSHYEVMVDQQTPAPT